MLRPLVDITALPHVYRSHLVPGWPDEEPVAVATGRPAEEHAQLGACNKRAQLWRLKAKEDFRKRA